MKRVLLIDDDTEIRAILKLLLQGEGFAVTEAGNGRDALAILETHPAPDLILLDLDMPVMDGFEFSSALDQDPMLKKVPRLVFSGRYPDSASASLEGLKFTDYVPKPCAIELLIQTVWRLIVEPNNPDTTQ